MRTTFGIVLTAVLGLSFLVTGCDLTGASDAIEREGQFRISLTDAPIDNMLEANVTIERVELLDTDGEVTVLLDEPQAYNLLELQNGVSVVLADSPVPFGSYAQIRVIVNEDAHVVWDDETTTTLKIPSGAESGIKLVGFQELEIDEESDEAEVMLDFDAAQSFVEAGNSGMVIFKPVIHVKHLELNDVEIDVEQPEGDQQEGAPFQEDLNF